MVTGSCTSMCPKHETEARTKQRRIHPLERSLDTNEVDAKRCVKEYVRSAAGSEKCDQPSLLRTSETLLQTVDYLLGMTIFRSFLFGSFAIPLQLYQVSFHAESKYLLYVSYFSVFKFESVLCFQVIYSL